MSKILIKTRSPFGGEMLCKMKSIADLKDVVLIAALNGVRVSCHRLVLSASSEFFAAMFTSPMLESQQEEVTLGEISGDYLEPLIDFCYTGEMEVLDADVDELLSTASFLQLNAAVEACSDVLERQLDCPNCLGTYALAERLNLDALKSVAEKFICENFVQICQHQEFQNLTFEQLATFIASDELCVTSEELVFTSVMSWVQHDATTRNEHIPALLNLVRLVLLSPVFLMDKVRDVCIAHGCQQLLMDVLFWKKLPESQQLLLNPQQTKPRKMGSMDLCVIFTGGIIEKYNPIDDSWSSFGKIDYTRDSFAVAYLNQKLIVMDGLVGGYAVGTVQSFDLKTNTRTQLNPMRTARYLFGVAVLDGLVYAVGGENGGSYLNSVERYDPVCQTWESVAPMITARSSVGVAALDGRLYALGGRNSSFSCLGSTECYNPHTNQWIPRANMDHTRNAISVAAGGGFLYAIGGCDRSSNLSSVERYNPHTDKWTRICSLSAARRFVSSAFIGERLFSFGGFYNDIDHLTNIVQEYDSEADTWTHRTALRHHVRPPLNLFSIPKMDTTN